MRTHRDPPSSSPRLRGDARSEVVRHPLDRRAELPRRGAAPSVDAHRARPRRTRDVGRRHPGHSRRGPSAAPRTAARAGRDRPDECGLCPAGPACDGAGQREARGRPVGTPGVEARCDGIVASAQEVVALRRRFGTRLRMVCPGIRLARATRGDPSMRPTRSGSSRAGSRDDQRRVCTPREALARGADMLIVGRPITGARDPRAATRAILHDMECGQC